MSKMMARFFIKAVVLSHMWNWMQTRSCLCVSGSCIFCHIRNIPLMGQVRCLLSTPFCKTTFMCSSLSILPILSMSWVEPEQVFLPESQPWAVVRGAACRQTHQCWDWAPAFHPLFLAAFELGGDGHCVSLQAPPVSPLSRLVASVFHDLCNKFLSHEK